MDKMKVLFLCEHNSARSQMAEGLLKRLYGEKYEVYSGGSTPTQVRTACIHASDSVSKGSHTRFLHSISQV